MMRGPATLRAHMALGCRHDMERRVGAHLFGITANDSGSTFLEAARDARSGRIPVA